MAGSEVDCVVIGAGFAGLSAAVRVADAGLKVVVLEQAPRLGGRATSFTDKTTGDRLDNGQHALFGCYRETYAFLRTIGTAHLAPLDPTLRLAMADETGRQWTLSCPRLPAPMHLLAGVMFWGALPIADRWSTLKLAPFLRDARRRGAAAAASDVPADLTVSQWLASLGQGARVRDWLWNPLTLAALNQSPDVAGAQAFARVLGELFGPQSDASSLGIPTVPLDQLYAEPAVRYIESRGGRVHLRTPAQMSSEAISSEMSSEVISKDGKKWATSAVISAVPWHALGELWSGLPPDSLRPIVNRANEIRGEPIVSVTIWFDRDVLTERQVGLVGTQFHWAFGNQLGGDFPGNRLRAHLVASGAGDLLRMENQALIELAERELRLCVPAARGATR
ncbi:MAG: hydroxysqualene dehydroxylase HpnE, partial [Acidobacteria bacterium]|nr:hydroxysqualene dehydroxylase HpnE [Acidobacteriota bacterium]